MIRKVKLHNCVGGGDSDCNSVVLFIFLASCLHTVRNSRHIARDFVVLIQNCPKVMA